MDSVERHRYILKKLETEGKVSVLDLCEELDVSSVTIRKDLRFLEKSNLLYRTHGGATKENPYTKDKPVYEKEKILVEEKKRIGQKAAELVEENDSIIIASGTTMHAFARELSPSGQLTVVTASLHVAIELGKYANTDIIQLGGILRKSSSSVTGIYSESLLKDFYCSKLFLGIDGLDLDYGITTTNAMEAQLNRSMIESAQKIIVLADSTKFGRKSFSKICDLEKIDVVITDEISSVFQEALEEQGIQVIISG
ncbi:MAG TPA: DeoR/GlpR family DNA-binding transcription regulator [Candidatus Sphingobacterium stercoripullorum]|uniref:DeoR/GlpR family DNA-binding transcription regulator n=1 Tax=Candidatus Sphingobacterium stercoripullorum TaxID=2838759 RepID=A0A9D1W788_9SPHI|nr:DeoR/GlpR family DNA-binding transcription regulator [Candidatus Sphingobacterium stercoripullorum]